MKGVELPINVLVIVAIAIIVLLGLVALYFLGFGPFSTGVSLQAAKSQGCQALVNQGCGDTDITVSYDVDGSGTIDEDDTLQALMEKSFGCTVDDIACTKRACACPGY
jgi:hypothetical protein